MEVETQRIARFDLVFEKGDVTEIRALGIKQHQASDVHRQSRARKIAREIVENNGNIIGQLNCVNLETQTKKYLKVLLQVLWFMVKEEIALVKFKSFVELLHQVECPGIVEWLNLSNVKQR